MKKLTPEQIEEATLALRNALAHGWGFVLCVQATQPSCILRQTNLSMPKEAKLLKKCAKLAKDWK